ncbi:MAG: Gfo/Idh/MocA family oxidoreductase [Planctomyces sp.]|nr:Gfo/Idh/MocA family oxidoreductase [Planctomyces sp.]
MQRREFLATTAFGAASLAAGLYAAPAQQTRRVALIGCGWYGKVDLLRLIQVAPVEVVSLCDVDSMMLAGAADIVSQRQKSGKKPRTYADYRELLAEKDADIVLIATPDHWHALPMIAACEAGADIYVQKPISVDVREGQAMVEAARKHGRVVQVGTQRRSTPHLAEAKRILDEGRLGTIGLVEIYCYYHMRARENPADEQPPENLDYELWTGPAPLRPYNKLVHPRSWRAFTEYGNGIVGDMCIHMLDMVRWMLSLGWPASVSSTGGILVDKRSKANISDTQSATFDYGDLKVVWTHRTWGDAPDPGDQWGATFYGDKGTLKANVHWYEFRPRGGQPVRKEVAYELEEYPEDKTEPDIEQHVAPAVRGHMRDLLENIDSRGKPVADIEEGHISTASCILANLSMELGRSLAFDPATHTIPGDAEATSRLARPYREPWTHPGA